MEKKNSLPDSPTESRHAIAALSISVLELLLSAPETVSALKEKLQEQYRDWWRSVYERKGIDDLKSYRRFHATRRTRLMAFRSLPLFFAAFPRLSFLSGKCYCVQADDLAALKAGLLETGVALSDRNLLLVETTAAGIVTFYRADGSVELMFPNSAGPSKIAAASWSWD